MNERQINLKFLRHYFQQVTQAFCRLVQKKEWNRKRQALTPDQGPACDPR